MISLPLCLCLLLLFSSPLGTNSGMQSRRVRLVVVVVIVTLFVAVRVALVVRVVVVDVFLLIHHPKSNHHLQLPGGCWPNGQADVILHGVVWSKLFPHRLVHGWPVLLFYDLFIVGPFIPFSLSIDVKLELIGLFDFFSCCYFFPLVLPLYSIRSHSVFLFQPTDTHTLTHKHTRGTRSWWKGPDTRHAHIACRAGQSWSAKGRRVELAVISGRPTTSAATAMSSRMADGRHSFPPSYQLDSSAKRQYSSIQQQLSHLAQPIRLSHFSPFASIFRLAGNGKNA